MERIFAEVVIEEVYDVPTRRSEKETCSSGAVGPHVSATGYAYGEAPRGLFMLIKNVFFKFSKCNTPCIYPMDTSIPSRRALRGP
ncbi:MAG: hypothetical protein JHC20_04360 [Pyrobaculum sp.]|nr:hypothetical protein [Pyrobaculum sp.]